MSSRKETIAKDDALATSKFIHPKARKSIALVKKLKKDSKKEKAKQETKLKQSLIADKLLWFQKHMDSGVCPYTAELTAILIERYIARNDEELEQIQIKRSIGENRNRQHSGREDAIKITKDRERGDYETCGLEIPDILNSTHCQMLMKWDGNIKYLSNFKFRRFSKRHLDEELKRKQRLLQKENKVTESENLKEVTSSSDNVRNKLNNLNKSKVDENNTQHEMLKKEDGMDVE